MAEEEPRTLMLLVQSDPAITIPDDPLELNVKGKSYIIEVQPADSYLPANILELLEGDTSLGELKFHEDTFNAKRNMWFVEYLHAKNMVNRSGKEIKGGSEEAKRIRSDPNRPPIGTLLMKSLLELAPLNGISAIELDVGWESGPFYTGLGFTELNDGKRMQKVLRRRRSRRNRRSKRKSRHNRRS